MARTADYHLIWVALADHLGNAMSDPGQTRRLAKAKELRRKAMLARRAASIPTSGSGTVDRVLVVLAAQLERDAFLLEQE